MNEELENITGIDIFQIRLWLDLAVESPKIVEYICPLTFGWVRDHLHIAPIEMTFSEYADLAKNSTRSCSYCSFLTRKFKVAIWHGCPCPCEIYKSVTVVSKLISTLLLEHRGLVNKKTKELKDDLVEVRVRRSMKKVQADMLEGD
jgi:hypothetical protein